MTTGDGATSLLAVSDLAVTYAAGGEEVALVNGASFEVASGEIVCLVGESGSGKSLTASALLGLLRRNRRMTVRGVIDFEGRDLNRVPERDLRELRGRDLAMIFQNPTGALDPVIPVGQQIAEAVRRRKVDRAGVRTRVLELIGQVGISDPRHRIKQFPHEISGGMCQRVAIAIALAGNPKLIVADEPTTALDVTIQAQILDLLKEIRRSRGMSVLLITHDMGVAAQVADRIVVMYAGSIVEEGPVGAFFAHPAHPYSLGLVRAVPRADTERVDRFVAIPGTMPEARDRPTGCAFHPRCPFAIDRCRSETPTIRTLGAQQVACHRAEEVRSGQAGAWGSVEVAASGTAGA